MRDERNGGARPVRLKGPRRLINAGDKKTAAKQFLSWKKPPEIMGRRKKEQKLFAEGAYSNGGKATVYPADAKGKVMWSKGKRIDLAKELEA